MLNLFGRRINLFHSSSTQVWNVPTNARFSATLYDMTCWLNPETHLPSNVRSHGSSPAQTEDSHRVQQYRWELCAAQSLDFFRELKGL